jgi:dihydrodipicolinate synthase/N-acetylneuraminate lyase
MIESAGFDDLRLSRRTLPVAFEGGAAQLLSTLVVTPLAAEFDSLSDEQRGRLVEILVDEVGGGPIESELESNVALARRV